MEYGGTKEMDKNEMMNEKTELGQEELEQVAAGTFTPNRFKKWAYHACGISTRYHTIDKDEFMFMGKPISYEQANQICELASDVTRIINTGASGSDVIGKSEPAFVRSFNSQLKLSMGLVWDGTPGSDF